MLTPLDDDDEIRHSRPVTQVGSNNAAIAPSDMELAGNHIAHPLPNIPAHVLEPEDEGNEDEDGANTDEEENEDIPVVEDNAQQWVQANMQDVTNTGRRNPLLQDVPAFLPAPPRLQRNKYNTPINAFKQFFTTRICNRFVSNTNAYAARTSRRGWSDISRPELLLFFCLCAVYGNCEAPLPIGLLESIHLAEVCKQSHDVLSL